MMQVFERKFFLLFSNKVLWTLTHQSCADYIVMSNSRQGRRFRIMCVLTCRGLYFRPNKRETNRRVGGGSKRDRQKKGEGKREHWWEVRKERLREREREGGRELWFLSGEHTMWAAELLRDSKASWQLGWSKWLKNLWNGETQLVDFCHQTQ